MYLGLIVMLFFCFFGFFAAFGRNHTFAIVVYQRTSLNVETG